MGNICPTENYTLDQKMIQAEPLSYDKIDWAALRNSLDDPNSLNKFYEANDINFVEPINSQNILQQYLTNAQPTKVDAKVVKKILQTGINVNHQDVYGMTALHYAAQKRPSLAVFKLLISAGANVNAVNKSGRCAMIIYLHVNFQVD